MQLAINRLVADTAGVIFGQAAEGFYKSTDEARTWQYISGPEYDSLGHHLDFAISRMGILFSLSYFITGPDAFYYHVIHTSHDQGLTWTRSIEVDEYTIQNIYVGLNDHVYFGGSKVSRSTDQDTSWQTIGEDIASASGAITQSNTGQVFAAANSVWTTETYVATNHSLYTHREPASNILSIYPNPASTGSTITIQNPYNVVNGSGFGDGNTASNIAGKAAVISESDKIIQLYTPDGRLIVEKVSNNTPQITISLQGLKPGLYQIRMGNHYAKLVVSNRVHY